MEPGRRTIGSVVRQRRLALRLSLESLAGRAGCAKSYVSEIENERRPGPPGEGVLRRLEAALSLPAGTLEELAAWARTPGPVRRRVQELETRARATRQLVDLFNGKGGNARGVGRSLDAAYRSGELRALIDSIAPPSEDGPATPGRSLGSSARPVERVLPLEVPLINAVAAGYPTEFTDLGYPARVADEYVRSPELADPDAFAARVVGDSMLPDYREGDIVIFSPARVVRSGMDCFVRLERDQESTFKRVYFQRARRGEPVSAEEADQDAEGKCPWIRLHALNPRYQARVVHREDVAGMYAGVSVTRTLG